MSAAQNKKDTWEGHVYQLDRGQKFHAVVSYNGLYGFEYPVNARGAGYDDLKDAVAAARAYADLLQEIGQTDRDEEGMTAKDKLPRGRFIDMPSVAKDLEKAAAPKAKTGGKAGPKAAAMRAAKRPKGL